MNVHFRNMKNEKIYRILRLNLGFGICLSVQYFSPYKDELAMDQKLHAFYNKPYRTEISKKSVDMGLVLREYGLVKKLGLNRILQHYVPRNQKKIKRKKREKWRLK